MDITKIAKKPTRHADEIRPLARPSSLTLRDLLTANESKTYLVGFLRDMANKKGPWREYYEFYSANQSGDIETMRPEMRKYVEKLVEEINKAYSDLMA